MWLGGEQGRELHTKGNILVPNETSDCPVSTCDKTPTKLHAEIGKIMAEENKK